ncbi:MAG: YihA family ribosome biogenesis GTP-binding protein [Lachnospiraceae bacterium]|nr:YihA family ribosome biogenesis GTP-binding protein [Lachnospiraceae bacterium]
MIIRSATLETVCGITSVLPRNALPEFAFCGRSNVGKSSLINALLNRRNLARTSGQPGKTQTINYYNINEQLYFVDLPGYGYARVSQAVRESWGKMIEKYLKTSKVLRAALVLVDARHEPSANDVLMYEWLLSREIPILVVATKADKLSRNELAKSLAVIRKKLDLPKETPLLPFSSETKAGRDELWSALEGFLASPEGT